MQALRARLREMAQQHMQADPAHDLAHLDRVWRNAGDIADSEGGNRRVLLGAAYLHDLINLPKDDADRRKASDLSAQAAAPLLQDLGFDKTEIAATSHAIHAHSFSAGVPPQSLEARVLRDADRLDALGAIGIARTFCVAGGLGRAIYHPEDPFALSRTVDDRQFSIDHWQVKLRHLPRDMLTARGREIAKSRACAMARFLARLGDEIGTPLPDNWQV